MGRFENDNELLYMIYQKDEIAINILVEKYYNLIHSTISRIIYSRDVYNSICDDFYQMGLIMINECLESFNPYLSVKFSTFFVLCLERKLRNQLRNIYRKGNSAYNMISLDAQLDDQNDYSLVDNIESRVYEYRGDYHVNHLNLKDQINVVIKDFPILDQEICRLRSEGYSYLEIAEKLACSYKKVDNTLQKFKRKLLTLLNEYDRVIKY